MTSKQYVQAGPIHRLVGIMILLSLDLTVISKSGKFLGV